MNIFKPILFAIGILLVIDGIGSIYEQPTQPFFWFQAVRIFRTGLGVACMVIATKI